MCVSVSVSEKCSSVGSGAAWSGVEPLHSGRYVGRDGRCAAACDHDQRRAGSHTRPRTAQHVGAAEARRLIAKCNLLESDCCCSLPTQPSSDDQVEAAAGGSRHRDRAGGSEGVSVCVLAHFLALFLCR